MDIFKHLKDNKEALIAEKKFKIKQADSISYNVPLSNTKGEAVKSDVTESNADIESIKAIVVINTTNILDSHGDLHVNGIWKKTVKEQQGRNYLVADHKLELDKVIAKKEDVEMFTAEIPFSLIGKSYEGNTEALIYKVSKNKIINPLVKEWLDSGSDIEASVRMRYISVKLAMNSTKEDDKEELKVYTDYISEIANKEDFDSIPYFFVISEAENVKESSLVLFGSNNATGTINNKEIAVIDTINVIEPTEVTQEEKKAVEVPKRKLSVI